MYPLERDNMTVALSYRICHTGLIPMRDKLSLSQYPYYIGRYPCLSTTFNYTPMITKSNNGRH
jgi:hypothetical protein